MSAPLSWASPPNETYMDEVDASERTVVEEGVETFDVNIVEQRED